MDTKLMTATELQLNRKIDELAEEVRSLKILLQGVLEDRKREETPPQPSPTGRGPEKWDDKDNYDPNIREGFNLTISPLGTTTGDENSTNIQAIRRAKLIKN